eukprot:UN30413
MLMLFFVLLYILQCSALIHKAQESQQPMIFASYKSLTGMAMYAPGEAPSSGPPGNGDSTVTAKLILTRDRIEEKAEVELLVVPDKDMSGVGTWIENVDYFCCTKDIQGESDGCRGEEDLNKLIITPQLKQKGFTNQNFKSVKFDANEKSKNVNWVHEIKKTGLNIMVVAVCDPHVGTLTVEGETTWLNPYGHLPGELYGFLPFYGWMCVFYGLAALVWFALNFSYWNELLSIHSYITFVLLMCLLEMATWYGDYWYLNQEGTRHRIPFIFGMMTSVTRRTVSRMLVVAVSLGHGIVKPNLPSHTTRSISILGFVYWIFAFMFEVFIHYHETNQVSPTLRLILTPPVAILDGIFWWWIFVSLHTTVIELTSQKQSSKLSLYRNFSFTLGFALVVAFLFACYQLYYIWSSLYLEQWQYMWVMEVGFWQMLF